MSIFYEERLERHGAGSRGVVRDLIRGVCNSHDDMLLHNLLATYAAQSPICPVRVL